MRAAHIRLKPGKFGVGFPAKRDEAVINAGGSRTDSVMFDFASDGGAVGTLSFGRFLPAGAIVTNIVADEITNITAGAGATIQLLSGAQALTDATLFSNFIGTATAALASPATAIKITADSELKMAIAVAALTAGKMRFFVTYRLANDGRT